MSQISPLTQHLSFHKGNVGLFLCSYVQRLGGTVSLNVRLSLSLLSALNTGLNTCQVIMRLCHKWGFCIHGNHQNVLTICFHQACHFWQSDYYGFHHRQRVGEKTPHMQYNGMIIHFIIRVNFCLVPAYMMSSTKLKE